MKRLVLWDIDKTLVHVGDIDRVVYREVFAELLGREPTALPPKGSGRTAPMAIRDVLILNHVDPSEVGELAARAVQIIPDVFAANADLMRREGAIAPGALPALQAVKALCDTVATVLTGNLRPNAILKLNTFELLPYVDTEVGGFGSDNPHRPSLVPLAQRRAAERYGHVFSARNTVIIGDSLEDVTAGIEGGASIIGVASGTTSMDVLRCAGANLVIDNLTDVGMVIDAILRLTSE